MMDGMGGAMWLWMLLWVAIGVAVLVLAVVATIFLVRRLGDRPQAPPPDSPEEVLRRRYAAGEIDEDEYLRRQSGL